MENASVSHFCVLIVCSLSEGMDCHHTLNLTVFKFILLDSKNGGQEDERPNTYI